ncbi:MAG: hypothetical protein DWI48_05060 [Chloroflexi bacterium]|nr:MAG: hypothetical protein DWI48_05060 [Chloroflexota bacterium]
MRWFPLTAALVAAFAAVVLAVAPQSVSAQSSAPAVFYGKGAPLVAGDKIAVLIGGATCGTATVNGNLEWAVSVAAGASCLPTEGATASVTVNGSVATVTPTPVWKVGGTPPDVANGYKITLGGTATTNPTATPVAGNTSNLISGSIPKAGGFGIVAVLQQAKIGDVVTATGCPAASMSLFATVGGSFVTYVPGTTIAAVNAAFLAQFPDGAVPTGTALIGKC